MAQKKHLEKIEQLFQKSLVVSFSDLDRIVKNRKQSNYTKQLVHYLVKRGKIKRIGKGCYTAVEELGVSVLCFKPAYLGLQSALSFHGLWEQETIPVIITANSIKSGARMCMGANILIRRCARKYLFGYSYEDDGGYYLPYSDIEKTLIDFFVFRVPVSREVLANFERKINRRKLDKYLSAYPQRIRIKVKNALANNVIGSSVITTNK